MCTEAILALYNHAPTLRCGLGRSTWRQPRDALGRGPMVCGEAMPTNLVFPQNPSRTRARDSFGSHLSPDGVGYTLVLALILASLVYGPPTGLAGEAEVGCVPAPERTA